MFKHYNVLGPFFQMGNYVHRKHSIRGKLIQKQGQTIYRIEAIDEKGEIINIFRNMAEA